MASKMFSQLKEQGFSLFKNLKDKSAFDVQTVQVFFKLILVNKKFLL